MEGFYAIPILSELVDSSHLHNLINAHDLINFPTITNGRLKTLKCQLLGQLILECQGSVTIQSTEFVIGTTGNKF